VHVSDRSFRGLAVRAALAAAVLCVAGSAPISAQRGGRSGQPSPVREVTIAPIAGVIGSGATWTVAWQGTDNADGLVATPDGGVLFAQEQPSRVRKLDRDDRTSVYVENTAGAGSLALDSAGRLLAVQRTCTDPGLNAPCAEPTRVAIIYPDTERRVLADNFQGKPLGRVNDLVVSRQGVVYFTSGGAYSVAAGGPVVSVGEELNTNGIMLSPDEKTLYVTNGGTVVAFDVQPDGSVRNQRDFAKLEAGGSGDGMAIDAMGRLYVTSQAGVQVAAPMESISVSFRHRGTRSASPSQDPAGRRSTLSAAARSAPTGKRRPPPRACATTPRPFTKSPCSPTASPAAPSSCDVGPQSAARCGRRRGPACCCLLLPVSTHEDRQCTTSPSTTSSRTSICGISSVRTVSMTSAKIWSAPRGSVEPRSRLRASRSARSTCARSNRCPWQWSQKLIGIYLSEIALYRGTLTMAAGRNGLRPHSGVSQLAGRTTSYYLPATT
jgi:gluconolactonase